MTSYPRQRWFLLVPPLDHQSAPFSRLSPAKTWATVTAKPSITSSQPWAGRLLNSHSTPRRPGPTRPSRAIRGVAQSSLSTAPPPTKAVRKKISFKDSQDNPDEVTHVVLMPTIPLTKQKEHKALTRRITIKHDSPVVPNNATASPDQKMKKKKKLPCSRCDFVQNSQVTRRTPRNSRA
ncbi:hypothetical protein CDAR_618801 [Caerostris darwini]|uniref:Uncharacterized protein n=1 Tax=Caerostris darwini TaxID=1538125 RepID=A0AAV4W137_9ARAC|nr:hypothetical protein CDAR_248291 [Caerostris darwini]GIY79112.1 hypothetical protein CDAR_618801 [Caerostris darwini]